MARIEKERKQSILKKMMSSHPPSIAELSREENVSEQTLYNWRNTLRFEGRPTPEHDRTAENWSAHTKFAIIVETAALNESGLAQYCRSKGLYPEQVKAWRETAIDSQDTAQKQAEQGRETRREDKKQIKKLEREILRKDRALAEAAALLVLQKKMRALWNEGEDE